LVGNAHTGFGGFFGCWFWGGVFFLGSPGCEAGFVYLGRVLGGGLGGFFFWGGVFSILGVGLGFSFGGLVGVFMCVVEGCFFFWFLLGAWVVSGLLGRVLGGFVVWSWVGGVVFLRMRLCVFLWWGGGGLGILWGGWGGVLGLSHHSPKGLGSPQASSSETSHLELSALAPSSLEG